MAKDEFNFDFEKEFGLEPGTFSDADGFDDGMTFTDEELGLFSDSKAEDSGEDFDMASLDSLLGEEAPKEQTDSFTDDFNFDIPEDPSFTDINLDDFSGFDGNDDAAELVSRKNREQAEQEPAYQELQEETPAPAVPAVQEEAQEPEKKERKPREPKKINLPKLPKKEGPTLFTKFVDLYFGPVFNKDALQEPQQDPANPRRRRRKSKMQIFKEVYLPPIVVCICLIMVMSFAVGAISNAVRERQSAKAREESQLQESQSAEELAQQRVQAVLEEAEGLAAAYNYTDAITVLETFLASVEDKSAYPEVTLQRSAYVTAQSQLVEYMDPSMIPNLSFHTLMVDPARSFQDQEYGGLYNRNFISIGEFQKILDEIYNRGYVLVDFDSFTTVNGDQIFPDTIKLPQGKKPIMITATMVNYWGYMINANSDGTNPDATGDGFAHKLVLENGEIKAAYVDSNGTTLIGDYDLIPILETFIKEHPDFSYQGARATVAIAGKEGVFGYRINSSYVSNTNNKQNGQTYVDGEIAGAKAIAQALKDKGYDLACYSYGNMDYGKKNANQINDDLSKWYADIVPVIGEVDKFVFAQFGDLTDYNGASFKVMREKGFKYFIANGSEPWAEVRTDYVRQKRLMVTGNALGWRQDEYEGIFDANAVVDMATRVSIPN